jgi:hypothetical protein
LDTVHLSTNLHVTSFTRQRRISELERGLRSFKISDIIEDQSSGERQFKDMMTAELYRLAALIYLNRAAIHSSVEETQYKRMVEEALSLLSQVKLCQAPWAFFVIACEAQSDIQRRKVLQLFSNKQEEYRHDNVRWLQRMVMAYWNQNDLDETCRLDYVTKFSSVIGSFPFLPAMW